MISLNQILSSNLDMLKSQEEELLNSLKFVQKAKQLFQSHWGSLPAEKINTVRRKKARKGVKPNANAVPVRRRRKTKTGKSTTVKSEKRIGHLNNILDVLKKNRKPMTSGDLIATLFKKQSADKDIKHYRLLIYPVLTKAYANKTLVLKDGKIHLAK